MVDIARPEYGTVWASEGEKLAPAQDKIELGWVQEMMPFQWENFLQARQDEAITYLLQKGIPEYSPTQEYIAQKSVVLYQGAVYLATQTVTGALPSVPASWKRVSTISDSTGVVTIAGGGTGATSAAQARTNLGLGSASLLNADVVVQKDSNGDFSAGVITASLAGNASSADKLKTPRQISLTGSVTSSAVPFDGSSNLAIPVTGVDASGLTSGTVPVERLDNAVTKTSLTGSALLPAGSTGQRDTPAQEAYFRYNKTTKLPEFYDSVGWKSVTGLNSGEFAMSADLGVANAKIAALEADGKRTTIGSAAMTATDNKIVMTGIVPALGLEKGDVIQIKITSPAYEKLHTVEGITNDGQIVVNYEHCGTRGNGSLKLPDYTGQVTIKRIAKWYNAAEGLGQDFVSITSLRVKSVDYVSPENRTIAVSITRQTVGGQVGVSKEAVLIVNGIPVASSVATNTNIPTAQLFSTVGSSSTYSASTTESGFQYWVERR